MKKRLFPDGFLSFIDVYIGFIINELPGGWIRFLSLPLIFLFVVFTGLFYLILCLFEIMMKRRIMMKKILKRSLALVVLVGLILFLGLISVVGFSWFSSWLNPSKPLNRLETDLNGYVIVEQGTKIIFPLWSWDSDRSLFPIKNYFEIVSILGNPRQDLLKSPQSQSQDNHFKDSEGIHPSELVSISKSPQLTNFNENDIWFLVRDCNSYEPRFFILRFQEDKDNSDDGHRWRQKKEERFKSRATLAELFSAGKFFDKAGKAIIKPTGYYLLVRKSRGESKEITLTANELNSESALNAQIFASKSKGKLVMVIDENKLRVEKNFLGLTQEVYSVAVEQVPINEIKYRPELEAGLPNPLNLWPQGHLIDWSQLKRDESLTKGGEKSDEQKK